MTQTVTQLDPPATLREKLSRDEVSAGDTVSLLGFDVRIKYVENFHTLYKNIFYRRLYHFHCDHPDPRVLDCGSHIGLSILYFKHLHPAARVIGFEPDPSVLSLLRENIQRNGLTDAEIVPAAVAKGTDRSVLYSDELSGGTLAEYVGDGVDPSTPMSEVECVRLRDYLDGPVDFLKMTIEGAETDVLLDCENRLRRIARMVVEYHHLPGRPRTLHKILGVLDRCGFDYLIHDFDAETNPKSQPPFRLSPRSRYSLLIYAQRRA